MDYGVPAVLLGLAMPGAAQEPPASSLASTLVPVAREDCIKFDSLRWMTGLADPQFQYHYLRTLEAWNVMRAQFGRPPYPWEKFLDRDEYDYTHGIRERPSPVKADQAG